MKRLISILFLVPLWIFSLEKKIEENEYTSVIYSLEQDREWVFNEERASKRFYPASTSKIIHSLIALSSGYAESPEKYFAWDGVLREIPKWNQDQTLRMAYKNSTIWVFQKITSDMGHQAMSEWIQKLDYGNCDIGDESALTCYWLERPLKISAREQIGFLKRLIEEKLLVDKEIYPIIKEMMLEPSESSWKIYSKTGWSQGIGWYVGWIEKDHEHYIFALNLDVTDVSKLSLRQELIYQAFVKIGILLKENGNA